MVVNSIQANVPDKIQVYCTATIDNCPDDIINNEYGNSIRRFIQSEHHLRDNVTISEMKHLSTRSLGESKYLHTVSIVLDVKTARLWESPAKYVRKHLGLDNYWTRSNGTVVRLTRIHQKD